MSNHKTVSRKIAERIMSRIEMARPTLDKPGGLPLLLSDIEQDVQMCLANQSDPGLMEAPFFKDRR